MLQQNKDEETMLNTIKTYPIEFEGSYFEQEQREAHGDNLIIFHDIEAESNVETFADNGGSSISYAPDVTISNIDVLDGDYETMPSTKEEIERIEQILIKKYRS